MISCRSKSVASLALYLNSVGTKENKNDLHTCVFAMYTITTFFKVTILRNHNRSHILVVGSAVMVLTSEPKNRFLGPVIAC